MKKYLSQGMGAVLVLCIMGACAFLGACSKTTKVEDDSTINTTNMDLNQFTWTREPKACVIADGRVEITTGMRVACP